MKLKSALLSAVACLAFTASTVSADEAQFDPAVQGYNYDGNGTLFMWGVPGAGSSPLQANPDYGWPKSESIAAWYATLLAAQQSGQVVPVGYDPNTFDIWYVGRPHLP